MKIILENPLSELGIVDLVPKTEKNNEWSVRKDRTGVDMVFYKDIPADEIIYAVGEISLSMTSNITTIQEEYYSEGAGDVFNIALKLIRDGEFAKNFNLKYRLLCECL